tara:strand:+ start:59 stop:712 length:654 start_codon:yes stop_codon:yes gene_type:complete
MKTKTANDDVEAWSFYPQHRWLFNKLDLALRLGYDAAPIVVPVTQSGKYVIRPIYNLYGMGIWATVKELNPNLLFSDHKVGRPGTFWCEYFAGKHFSVDYEFKNGKFTPFDAMQGEVNDSNLSKFNMWVKINAPNFVNNLPNWLPKDVKKINVEWRGDKIIEIHLRTGNDFMHDLAVGTIATPVWENHKDIDIKNEVAGRYDANGYVNINRLGYKIN